MLAKEVCLLHDNARPHTANATKQIMNSLGWDVLNHLRVPLTCLLESAHGWNNIFNERGNGELGEGVAGHKKMIPRFTPSVERDGDYVEKIFCICTNVTLNFFK